MKAIRLGVCDTRRGRTNRFRSTGYSSESAAVAARRIETSFLSVYAWPLMLQPFHAPAAVYAGEICHSPVRLSVVFSGLECSGSVWESRAAFSKAC